MLIHTKIENILYLICAQNNTYIMQYHVEVAERVRNVFLHYCQRHIILQINVF